MPSLLEPFGLKRFYTDEWGAYERLQLSEADCLEMHLSDPIRTIEIRVNQINSDPIMAKRNALLE
jgi:hypothetical protein